MCSSELLISFYFLTVPMSFLVLFLYYYQRRKLNYWKDRGVSSLETNWIFGSCKDEFLKRRSWMNLSKRCYNAFKDKRYGGYYFFNYPILVVCSPDLVDKILVQDFAYFKDRGKPLKEEILLKTLFNAQGEEWRRMRHKLIPSFTSKKVNGMFEQIVKCCDYAFNRINNPIDAIDQVEVETLAFTYSTEVIASCAFGIQLLTDSDRRNSFRKAINTIFSVSFFRLLKISLVLGFSKLTEAFGITLVQQDLTNYFVNLTKSTLRYRKENKVYRNDFLQLLIDLKEEEDKKEEGINEGRFCTKAFDSEKHEVLNHVPLENKNRGREDKLFTDDRITALVFNFVSAGLKPLASTIGFCLYEVANNLTIQKKLQKDIESSLEKHNGWNFEAVNDMTYLDQAVQETLRMYSFNTLLVRKVTEPYQIPGTNLVLEKDLIVYIPVTGLHMDPQRYPTPEVFNPDRFEGNNYKPSPFYLPFGNGPRICIAVKFIILVLKTCLARVLFKYEMKIGEKMQTPLMFDQNEAYFKAKDGIWLSFNKREEFSSFKTGFVY